MTSQRWQRFKARGWQVLAAVVVATVGVGSLVFLVNRLVWGGDGPKRNEPAPVRASAQGPAVPPPAADAGAHSMADAATAETTAEPAPIIAVAAVRKANEDQALRILARPAELRVWANTRVRLQVENTGTVQYERYIWHFEDGSDPVVGVDVEHIFAESVRDRHVTVEALRAGQANAVVSRRLPVERLAVVPVDGEIAAPGEAALPAARGLRLIFAGGPMSASVAAGVLEATVRTKASLLVATDPAAGELLRKLAEQVAPDVAVALWPTEPGVAAGQPAGDPPLQWLRNPDDRIAPLRRGARDLLVWTAGDLALAVVDTRGETVAEPDLKRLRDGLQAAGVFPTSLLLTARPLTLLRDGELIADRAYRIYEHALRHQVTAVVSAASGVWYDGRFGSARIVAVGRAQAQDCLRLSGSDGCQLGAVTVVDTGGGGKVVVTVMTGAHFDHVVGRQELPAEVGKVRR